MLLQGASPVRGTRTVRRDSSQRSQGSLGMPQARGRQQQLQMQSTRGLAGVIRIALWPNRKLFSHPLALVGYQG